MHLKPREIQKSADTAELIGIVLGDGHIHEPKKTSNTIQYFLEISLNGEETEIKTNIQDILYRLSGLKPRLNQKEGKAQALFVSSKKLVENLKRLGLTPGNKTENQVGIPDWILAEKEFCRRCLRGLIDTDGSIYYDKREGDREYKRISFKNASENLLQDFITACSKLDIKAYKGGYRQVQVSMKDIDPFCETVKPIKDERFD